MRHILDAEGDPDQYVRTLEADAIHCIVHGFGEEAGEALVSLTRPDLSITQVGRVVGRR